MKVLLTNWINIAGVFGAGFLFAMGEMILEQQGNIAAVLLGPLFLILLYGLTSWCLFIASLFIFDLLFIVKSRDNLLIKLAVEWLLISSPFIYWTIIFHEWIFGVCTIAFFVTQFLRIKLIVKAQTSGSR
ncbi:hypothetical protein [Mucilaginibacter sp. FT3.2]|uniref:hypothetical protein n=1 Tax=Mucilaginibacter sp. FT3.2 TaxID=2723090 RepID=UPI001617E0A6|nr:hypothetical protein [Mucilaginibacter sp. FT3.2]MBB6232043.1 hypothetical protein [Mucilaginibacter sp. FT3.2]